MHDWNTSIIFSKEAKATDETVICKNLLREKVRIPLRVSSSKIMEQKCITISVVCNKIKVYNFTKCYMQVAALARMHEKWSLDIIHC